MTELMLQTLKISVNTVIEDRGYKLINGQIEVEDRQKPLSEIFKRKNGQKQYEKGAYPYYRINHSIETENAC